jgi:hypothetical protein
MDTMKHIDIPSLPETVLKTSSQKRVFRRIVPHMHRTITVMVAQEWMLSYIESDLSTGRPLEIAHSIIRHEWRPHVA